MAKTLEQHLAEVVQRIQALEQRPDASAIEHSLLLNLRQLERVLREEIDKEAAAVK